jgi:hypothetical protein
MYHAWEVDASAIRANKTRQARDKGWKSRSDGARHLGRCKCGLEFSNWAVFIITLSFYLLELTVQWICFRGLHFSLPKDDQNNPARLLRG